MEMFSTATRTWFTEAFAAPTAVQTAGWATIARGDHSLLIAPTGSGKTLAAFLWAIDAVLQEAAAAEPGVRVVYVSPLKALVHDVERSLRAPLIGIRRVADRLGAGLREVAVDVRTGDTPGRDRERQRRRPQDILVTTPESLFLLLGSRTRSNLATVHTVIVDEVHAVAGSKRGVHLALSLERLAELCARDPQRIGLSATVRPTDEVAAFLGGDREVAVVDAGARPDLELRISVPVEDMEAAAKASLAERPRHDGESVLGAAAKDDARATRNGMWSAIVPEIVQRIRDRRSTIVFVNSRGLCERLANQINEAAAEDLVLAHHGSVSHDKRRHIEESLKAGTLPGIVATSSLELGIDMGAVDQVILAESPRSVASGLQRVGRAGHGVGETSRGEIYPKYRGDLLECTAIARGMLAGSLEALRTPQNALDVLAQQVIAMVCERPRRVAEIEEVVRRAHPYRKLSRQALTAVVDMLSGRYPSDDFADLRPRLSWNRANDVLTARRGSAMLSRLNAGTIPDRGLFTVHLGDGGPRLGELDEEMVYESRTGDVILLGASSWRIVEITRDRVLVEPAPGEPGRLPFWHGDGAGRAVELGRAIGELTREIGSREPAAAERWLRRHAPLDELAARNLVAYVHAQKEHTGGVLPTDRAITIERFRDEVGDWRMCILTPFGRRLHAPWAMALQTALSARSGFEVATTYTDDGLVLTMADGDGLPDVDALLPDPDQLEELVTDQLTGSALFGALFRENAATALLLPKRSPRARAPLWAQRLKAKNLLGSVLRFGDFPIVLETMRQCLRDVFDLPALAELLQAMHRREVRIDQVETESASPFARSLVFAWVAAFMYEYDAPLAERRAQALTLDRGLLRDLLGEAELRTLLDAAVVAEVEAELQHLAPNRQARDADELHDVLRRLGALREDELAERTTAPPQPWLEQLRDQRRAVAVRISGQRCWIAAQDAGLYRDGLGAVPPPGLPETFLAPAPDPLTVLVRRHARCHGPFTATGLADALRVAEPRVAAALATLAEAGIVVRGAIRPGGSGVDWCDAEVLRRIKRRTLARLRGKVAPVEAPVLARFLPRWHGIGSPGRTGLVRLLEVVEQLEGCALPWSALARAILPARVPGYEPELLDMACAQGEVVWVGRGAIGSNDGRVALYRRDGAAAALDAPTPLADATPVHGAILAHLGDRGATFTTGLRQALRRGSPGLTDAELEAALWDLVWAGQITNDTFGPLRGLGRRSSGRRARSGPTTNGGRWSLVAELIDPEATATSRTHRRALGLLYRYGVLSREAAAAEELPGGFGSIYQVLRAMEDSGRVRRGLFVAGLRGAQFAVPGAIDRLRTVGEDGDEPSAVTMLDATDPAQPWGALLPWPATGGGADQRPRRVPGAWVLQRRGEPVLWVAANRRSILTLPGAADPDALAAALATLAELPGRTLVIERIDGEHPRGSRWQQALVAAGFVDSYRGFVRRTARGA